MPRKTGVRSLFGLRGTDRWKRGGAEGVSVAPLRGVGTVKGSDRFRFESAERHAKDLFYSKRSSEGPTEEAENEKEKIWGKKRIEKRSLQALGGRGSQTMKEKGRREHGSQAWGCWGVGFWESPQGKLGYNNFERLGW